MHLLDRSNKSVVPTTSDARARLELSGAGEVDEATAVRAASIENIRVAFADFLEASFYAILEHIHDRSRFRHLRLTSSDDPIRSISEEVVDDDEEENRGECS